MSNTNKWLGRLNTIIGNDLSKNDLTNGKIAQQLNVSERQLFRKAKTHTGYSPQQYIRMYKMKNALKYLQNGNYRTVKEMAYAVGYLNVGYFIRQFQNEHGRTPLQVLKAEGWR